MTGLAVPADEAAGPTLARDLVALTKPRINKLIGFDREDRTNSPERVRAITQWLAAHNESHDGDESKDIAVKNRRILQGVNATGAVQTAVPTGGGSAGHSH